MTAYLLLGRQVLLDVGLDAPKHEGPEDGVQLLDHVVSRALVRLQAECRRNRHDAINMSENRAVPCTVWTCRVEQRS